MSNLDDIVSSDNSEKDNDENGELAVLERLKASLLTMDFVKAALASSDPFDLLSDNDKAFIGFSKIFTLVAVAYLNALNFFATTLALGPGRTRVTNDPHTKAVQTAFVCMTLISMPFTAVVAGLAHATEYATSAINFMSVMLVMECLLISATSGLYAYYLTDLTTYVSIFYPILFFVVFVLVLGVSFQRPSLMGVAARLKKKTPASDYLKKVIKDNNLQDPAVMARYLEEIPALEVKKSIAP